MTHQEYLLVQALLAATRHEAQVREQEPRRHYPLTRIETRGWWDWAEHLSVLVADRQALESALWG